MSDHLIVIPAFDEAPTLARVVSRARRHGTVLVVDDGSGDGSGAVASAAGADVIRLERRQGKGEALRQGWSAAIERGVDRVVTLDGDGQHDPDDIPRLLSAASRWPSAIVIGNRLAGGQPMTAGRLAALRVAGFFIGWLTEMAVADTQSGFRVYPVPLLQSAMPRRGGFVLETEVLIRGTAAGWQIVEVPVTPVGATSRPSRFRPARDGIAVGGYLAGHVARRWGREAAFVVAALARPFTAERRQGRHRAQAAFAAPHRHNPAAWALAVGVFTLDSIAQTWGGWLRDPRARALMRAALATAATPVLLGLALIHGAASRRGFDAVTAFTRRVYGAEALADLARRAPPDRAEPDDVLGATSTGPLPARPAGPGGSPSPGA